VSASVPRLCACRVRHQLPLRNLRVDLRIFNSLWRANSSGRSPEVARPTPAKDAKLLTWHPWAPPRLSAADTLTRLIGCNLNARNLPDGGFRAIAKLARSAPAISLQYGEYIQLDGTLDVIVRMLLDNERGVTPKFLSMLPCPRSCHHETRQHAGSEQGQSGKGKTAEHMTWRRWRVSCKIAATVRTLSRRWTGRVKQPLTPCRYAYCGL
jgi:hypothetical protein